MHVLVLSLPFSNKEVENNEIFKKEQQCEAMLKELFQQDASFIYKNFGGCEANGRGIGIEGQEFDSTLFNSTIFDLNFLFIIWIL